MIFSYFSIHRKFTCGVQHAKILLMIILESYDFKGKFAGYITRRGALSFAVSNEMTSEEMEKSCVGVYKIVKNTVFSIYAKDENCYFQADDYAVLMDEFTQVNLNRTGKNLLLDNIMDTIGIRHVFRLQRNQLIVLTYKYLFSDVLPNLSGTVRTSASYNGSAGPKGSELNDFFLFAKNMLNDPDRRNIWFKPYLRDTVAKLPDTGDSSNG